MSCDQQLCPGVGGRRCGTFMSPLFRDPHPTCVRCRGVKCMSDVTCGICKDWSVAQWEVFLKRRPYSECRKKRLSGSALPSVPPTLPPSASARSLPHPSEGRDRSGETEGIPCVGSREVSPPPSRLLVGVERGAPRGPWLLRARAIRLLSPSRG